MLDSDPPGREQARQARRGDQDVPEQPQGGRPADGGDFTHVPDHRPLAVQVGGGDQQTTTLGVARGHRLEHRLVDEGIQQPLQLLALEHAAQRRRQTADAQQLGRVPAGIGVAELVVPGGAQEGERRDQGAGADPGDDGEVRTGSGGGQPDQHAGPERAAGRAAGDGQDVEVLARDQDLGQRQAVGGGLERLLRLLDGQADAMEAGNLGVAGRRGQAHKAVGPRPGMLLISHGRRLSTNWVRECGRRPRTPAADCAGTGSRPCHSRCCTRSSPPSPFRRRTPR